MKRPYLILVAVGLLLAPVLVIDAHAESALADSTGEQEVVITGHETFDPEVHIERPSGTIQVHCPACVLHKTPAGEKRVAGTPGRADTKSPRKQSTGPSLGSIEPVSLSSPRAPPSSL